MGEPKSKKMDFEQAVAPVKQALQFLPEQDRPDFEEFVEKTASNVIKSVTEKQEFKNCRFPPMFLAENADWQYENWKPNKGDVLISTYPKTGKICYLIVCLLSDGTTHRTPIFATSYLGQR